MEESARTAMLPSVPLPVHVNVETSLLCNLSCVMCAPHLTGSTKKRDTVSNTLLEEKGGRQTTPALLK